jgi:hypothetical protein
MRKFVERGRGSFLACESLFNQRTVTDRCRSLEVIWFGVWRHIFNERRSFFDLKAFSRGN